MDNKIKSFTDLGAWKESHKLVLMIYDISKNFSREEMFGLTIQIRRAAVSITSNIAEGFENRTNLLFRDYLGRAKASSGELRSQLYVAKDNSFLGKDDFSQLFELCDKCSRQISGFIQYLAQRPNAIREEGIEYNV